MRMIGCITVEETHMLYPEDQWPSMEEFIKTIVGFLGFTNTGFRNYGRA
jgi:hypothetical protein